VLYTDDKDALRHAIKRTSAKMAAVDLVTPDQQLSWRQIQAERIRKLTVLVRTQAGFQNDRMQQHESERQVAR